MKDKIIIVTGGSGLLGGAMLRNLWKQEAIAINFDIDQETNLSKGFVHCNITSTEDVDAALKQVLDHHGRIDGLVNNAYPRTMDWGTPFEDISYESWQKNVDMQLNSYFYISQQVLKHMREKNSGSIVNIASIYGVVGNDFTIYEDTPIVPAAAYSAIKGGLINLTRYLASLYGQYGIRVNSVSPGGIFDYQPEKFVQAYVKKVPLKRMGTPEDIAPPVSFLLSDEARYITGHNLMVDGGWTAI